MQRPREVGTRVLLPPPVLEGGNFVPSYSQPQHFSSSFPHALPFSTPLPSFPPPISWPSSLSARTRVAEERERSNEERGEEDTISLQNRVNSTLLRQQSNIRNVFQDERTETFAERNTNRSRNINGLQLSLEDEEEGEDDSKTTNSSKSLSFSHSHVQPPDKSDDYDSVFEFVNKAHDLGWCVENKLQKNVKSDRSLNLHPPSALIAENNVFAMQNACATFERKRPVKLNKYR